MLRQVVPGQLGVLTLGWDMVHVPRDVGGQAGADPAAPAVLGEAPTRSLAPARCWLSFANSSREVGSLLGS